VAVADPTRVAVVFWYAVSCMLVGISKYAGRSVVANVRVMLLSGWSNAMVRVTGVMLGYK